MTSASKPQEILQIEDVKTLIPGFDGEYGWISTQELNCIDPNCTRFKVLDEAMFIDNTMFVLITPC